MRPQEVETWTPKLVGKVLVEAVKWAQYNAGPTGPAAVRSLMPVYAPSILERLEQGWGFLSEAPADPKPTRRALRPEEVSRLIEALQWPAKYAVPELPTSARILNLWIRSKVYRVSFSEVIDAMGDFSRATSYRYRDKALSAIAQGLERDGVPLP